MSLLAGSNGSSRDISLLMIVPQLVGFSVGKFLEKNPIALNFQWVFSLVVLVNFVCHLTFVV